MAIESRFVAEDCRQIGARAAEAVAVSRSFEERCDRVPSAREFLALQGTLVAELGGKMGAFSTLAHHRHHRMQRHERLSLAEQLCLAFLSRRGQWRFRRAKSRADFERAREDFTKVALLSPQSAPIWLSLGLIETYIGSRSQALIWLSRSRTLDALAFEASGVSDRLKEVIRRRQQSGRPINAASRSPLQRGAAERSRLAQLPPITPQDLAQLNWDDLLARF